LSKYGFLEVDKKSSFVFFFFLKANLFQTQFQLFQKEYLDKEEGLKTKLRLLQDDYLNLETELREKKDQQLIKSDDNVVELDASKLNTETKQQVSDELDILNQNLRKELQSLGKSKHVLRVLNILYDL